MFKTNLKIAWRNLLKDKQFAFLNVLGLAAGLACTLLIFLWVTDELNYDKIFANDDRLYKLFELRSNDAGGFAHSEESSGRLSEAVKGSVTGVEYAAAVAPSGWFAQNTLSANAKNIKASGQYAEKDYFNIFSFPLLDGNRNEALARNNSIALSDELAMKLFDSTRNVVGKAVQFDHDTTFFVSAVFKKMPANSSQQFDFVLSFDYFKTVKTWVTGWRNTGPLNYVMLKPGVDINDFNRNVSDIINRNSNDKSTKVMAIKFSDVYLHNNYNGNVQSGRIEYVKLFSLLAVFVLVIACINFMNLSTAKAARRFKEVGIKKVVGAERKELIAQFLVESLLLTLIAMLFAAAIAWLLLPAFNQITGKTIVLHFTWQMALAVVCIALVTAFVAGSYPALYISKFNPLSLLKGKLNTSTAELLSRKGLVVFQFTLSTVLIVAVFIIYQQIQFIQNTQPGYNKANVLRLAAEGGLATKQDAFLAELKTLPGVNNAAATHHRMVGHSFATANFEWPGKPAENGDIYFEGFEATYDFVETMGMQLKEGRSFSKAFGADSASIILNETAVNAMHLKDPVGKIIQFNNHNVQVIGVVKDFHFESMHDAIKPSYIQLLPAAGTIVASLRADHQQATINAIQKLYEKFNPGFPFTFNFLDEAYQQQYESETRVSVLSKYFAGLAIIISCLGLFGLTAFTAQRRRKEIGIRKVIGASTANITAMLSTDLLKLVLLSLLIAFPLSWWVMNNWLQSFAYRIKISPLVFFIAALSVVFITVITVGYQAIKAAIANPVKSLRTE